MKRSGKFYRKNEAEVMKALGLKPTPNSGSGPLFKEDGDNDYLICQLKSTDAQSIRVHQKDIRMLEHNATISHKIPIFAIQFLNTGEVWLMAKPIDFQAVSEYLDLGYIKQESMEELIDFVEEHKKINVNLEVTKIKSSGSARKAYNTEQENKYKKFKSAI